MNKLIYTRPDGGVSIVIPAPKAQLEKGLGPMTTPEYEAHVMARSIPADAINVQPVLAGDIPTDRHFRNAWRQNAAKVAVDMPLARVIHMDHIRIARDEKLKLLDIEARKGNDVAVEAQALRDLPQTFDLSGAATPDELKALWPLELAQ